jgi:hypothetical protein
MWYNVNVKARLGGRTTFFLAFLPAVFIGSALIGNAALLPYCLIALLPYCLIALLPYCLIALLPYCLIALLPYCLTALMP